MTPIEPLSAPSPSIIPQTPDVPTQARQVFGVSPPTPQKPQPAEMREFGDSLTTRRFIYEDALAAAQGIEPVEDDKHVLKLSNVAWHDPERFTRKQRKNAVLTGQTLARRMRGTWELYDKATGSLIQKRNQIVGAVPYLTSMGTFVHRGNEYTVNNQQRLRPGVFARRKDNGELESHFNILPGKGVSHRYFFDPDKSLFKVKFGQSEMPVMPLLKAMGATDAEIRDAWYDPVHKDAVWQANTRADEGGIVLKKLAQRLLRQKDWEGATPGDATRKLVDRFNSMELDPEVTRRTLGQGYDRVTKEAILAATGKLLKVSRKEIDPDDRDHLAYQSFFGPEDLFAERIRRDHGNLRRSVFREISRAGSLDKMRSGVLTPQLQQVLIGSGLAQALEEINPAEVFDKQTRITRLGEGGIPSVDAVPDEARSVQPSHMGFMDPIRTPECYDVETEVMTRHGWKGWPHVTPDDQLACLVVGRLEWHRPEKLHREDWAGELIGVKTATLEYLVTPNHRLWVRPKEGNGQYRIEIAADSFMKPRFYRTSHAPVEGEWSGTVEVPGVEFRSSNTNRLPVFDCVLWSSLVGWYLGEGLTVWRDPPGDYRVCISQCPRANPENCREISTLLDRLGLRWSFNASMKCFVLCGKQLTAYFRQFGYSSERYIPEDLLTAPIEARHALLASLLKAEGRKNRAGKRTQFCTTSLALAEGVQRLAFSLGQPTVTTFEKDDRQPHYKGCYVVHMHERAEREAHKRNYYKVNYSGPVYCATVPGGLLYVRRGNTSGHWSGNSFRVGVDVHMAHASRKGRDGRIYTQMKDKTGNLVWKTPQDLSDAAITTTDALKWDTKRIPVMKGGRQDYVSRDQVDYVVPNFEKIFSPLGNLVPMKSGVKPGRVSMGARYMTQALPVIGAESPFVQSGIPGHPQGWSFEDEFGKHMGAVRADKGGRVMGIKDGVVQVKYDDGKTDEIELYQHHPFNRKSVTGDTEIFVKRRTKVWRTRIDAYAWQAGDLTLSIDPATKKSAWLAVTGYTAHRNDKTLLRVRTRSGRDVVVTEDHSLITLDDVGEMTPVYPKDCVVGKTRLPVASLPQPPLGASNDDHPIGVLDGLYLAEGHCPPSQPGLVCIAVADDERAEQVLRFLRGMVLDAYRNGGNVCFTDHAKCRRLVGDFGHLSHAKKIPDWVFSASWQYRHALVQGYMAGDGCLWADTNGAVQLTAVSVSKSLRDGLVDVLSSLGVFTTLFDADRSHMNDNWRDGYGFRVLSRQICNLDRWFFYTDREAKLRRILKKAYRASEFEAVPVTKAGRKTLYAGFTRVPKYVHKVALSGAVAKHRMRDCTGVYGDWAKSDVMWDTIVAIEPVPHEDRVYDLSVAGAETFAVCRGLIVHNTYIHQEPAVRVGDVFKPGQLLAKSNYTDGTGATALGLNMRTAYFPYKGLNFEDAIVLSESAAKRLTSEHMYQHDVEVSDKHKMGKKPFLSLFASKFDKKTLDRMDDDGIIKVGEKVEFGQPLILAARERDRAQNKIHKKRQAGYNDESVLWKHHDPGVVTDVVWGKNGPVVLVKSQSSMQVGDKMSGRYGDKGVVSAIVPDGHMPHDADGVPFEVLLSPDGTITRTNPTQTIEAALGKIAAKTGKPVKVPDFEDIDDLQDWADKELAKHGLTRTEDVIWPEKNMRVRNIGTGNRFFMKLHHTAESKGQGRSSGAYSMDETPAKGGETGCFTGDTDILVQYERDPNVLDGCGVGPMRIADVVGQRFSGRVPTVELPRKRSQSPKSVERDVTDWFHYEVPHTDLVTVTLDNGESFSCTRNHELVRANHKRVLAGDLVAGDALLRGI